MFTKTCFLSIVTLSTIIVFYFYALDLSIPQCPNNKILTVESGGRTGNAILEYMSVLAVSNLWPELFTGYVPDAIVIDLEEYFERLSLPKLSELHDDCFIGIPSTIEKNWTVDKLVAKSIQSNSDFIVLDTYSARYKDIIEYGLQHFRTELRFKENAINEAQEVLHAIKSKYKQYKNPIFVGVHYRGDDYPSYLHEKYNITVTGLSTYKYYNKAMQYFKSKYKEVIFILVSSDTNWVERNKPLLMTETIFIANERIGNQISNAKLQDLTLLSYCNHTIVNYGTFGVATALYNGGETIVFDLKLPIDHRGATIAMGIAQELGYWHKLDNL